jgi:hypothetical protein
MNSTLFRQKFNSEFVIHYTGDILLLIESAFVDNSAVLIGQIVIYLETGIQFTLAFAILICHILSATVVLIALTIPLKGSTRSCLYAAGSVVSFLVGGTIGWFETFGPPGIGGMVYYIGVHNIVGVLFGYLFLFLAISRYKRNRKLLPSTEPT